MRASSIIAGRGATNTANKRITGSRGFPEKKESAAIPKIKNIYGGKENENDH